MSALVQTKSKELADEEAQIMAQVDADAELELGDYLDF